MSSQLAFNLTFQTFIVRKSPLNGMRALHNPIKKKTILSISNQLEPTSHMATNEYAESFFLRTRWSTFPYDVTMTWLSSFTWQMLHTPSKRFFTFLFPFFVLFTSFMQLFLDFPYFNIFLPYRCVEQLKEQKEMFAAF